MRRAPRQFPHSPFRKANANAHRGASVSAFAFCYSVPQSGPYRMFAHVAAFGNGDWRHVLSFAAEKKCVYLRELCDAIARAAAAKHVGVQSNLQTIVKSKVRIQNRFPSIAATRRSRSPAQGEALPGSRRPPTQPRALTKDAHWFGHGRIDGDGSCNTVLRSGHWIVKFVTVLQCGEGTFRAARFSPPSMKRIAK